MPLPTFPTISPALTLEQSLNMILASIAMEELGLSHIINAEGEKLQHILKKLDKDGDDKDSIEAAIEETLAVNKSVKCILDSIMQNQVVLKDKMALALGALKLKKPCPPWPEGLRPTISFQGCPEQYWTAGKPLRWLSSRYPQHLSSDCSKIILGQGKYYVVSFSINLCVDAFEGNCISASVQTCDCHKKADKFICNLPIVHENTLSTVSSSGILISTRDCPCTKELMITLLSPDSVKVSQSSICVTEI